MKGTRKQQAKAANELLEKINDGGPLPGEGEGFSEPTPTGSTDFSDIEEDDFGRTRRFPTFFEFKADGDSFTGKFVRLWDKGEHEHLENRVIEMVDGDGLRYYLSGFKQLWDLLEGEISRGVNFDKRTYRFTRELVKELKVGTFMQFRTQKKDEA